MIQWRKYPMMKLILPLIGGILFAVYSGVNSEVWFYALLSCFILSLALSISRMSKQLTLNPIVGICFATTTFFLGINLTILNTPKFQENYFAENNIETDILKVRIISPLVKKKNSHQATLNVLSKLSLNEQEAKSGKILAYFSNEMAQTLNYGDEVIIRGDIVKIEEPLNPGQFNYRNYLEYHGVYHRVFLNETSVVKTNVNNGNWLIGISQGLRKKFLKILSQNGLEDDQFPIASALILGQREFLDQDTVKAYSTAGAMHVLAVSGLHVGIFYMVLMLLFKPLAKRKYGRLFSAIFILISLWFYAMITGLSPSVLRATTMFSFIVFANLLNRNASIYNTIAGSAFLLLCINPMLIMQVGFQLSYLAVLGIVYFQPKIYGWFYIENRLLDYVWKISGVSIAAQLATFPLGLLYFHQFPVYFLISNLVVIPAAFIILALGMSVLLFSIIPAVSIFFAGTLNWVIFGLNKFIFWIDSLPLGLIEGISIGVLSCWLIYWAITMLILAIETKRMKYLSLAILGITCFVGLDLKEDLSLSNRNELVIYSVPKEGLTVDWINGSDHYFMASNELFNDWSQLLFHVKHNWFDMDLHPPKFIYRDSIYLDESMRIQNNLYSFGSHSIFALKKNTVQFPTTQVDILYVEDYFTWKKHKEVIVAEKIIASNEIKEWQVKKMEMEIELHWLKRDGAFQLEL